MSFSRPKLSDSIIYVCLFLLLLSHAVFGKASNRTTSTNDDETAFPLLTQYPRGGIAPLYPFHDSSLSSPTTSSSQAKVQYSVLIDAGSTGSRISIYSFQPRVIQVPVSQCTPSTFSNHDSNHQECTSAPILQSKPTQPFSTPSTSTIFSKKVTPGLHTVLLESVQTSTVSIRNHDLDNEHTIVYDTTVDLPTLRANIVTNLSPLVSFVIEKFTELGVAHQIPYTPLYLLSTGGVRSLLVQERQLLLQTTQDYLSSSGFYIDTANPSVTTVSGELEGLFGWISVNYLLSNSTIFNPSALADQQAELNTLFEQKYGKARDNTESTPIPFRPVTATDLLNNPNINPNHEHQHDRHALPNAPPSSPTRPPQLKPPRPVGVIDLGGATLQLALAENSASINGQQELIDPTDSTSFLSSYPFSLGSYKAQCFIQCFWYYGKDTSLYRIHNILYNMLYGEEIWAEQQSFLQARGDLHQHTTPLDPTLPRGAHDKSEVLPTEVHRPLIKSTIHVLDGRTPKAESTTKAKPSRSKPSQSKGQSDDFVDRQDSFENEQYTPIDSDEIVDTALKSNSTEASVDHWTKKQLPHHWKTTVDVTKYQTMVEQHNYKYHMNSQEANRKEFDRFLRFVHNNPHFEPNPDAQELSHRNGTTTLVSNSTGNHFDFSSSTLPKPSATAANGKSWDSLTRSDLSTMLKSHDHHAEQPHNPYTTRLFRSPCLPKGYETPFQPYSQFLTPLDPKHPINNAVKLDDDPSNDSKPFLKEGQPFGTDIIESEYDIYIIGESNFDECYQLAKQLVISRTTTPCYNTDPQMNQHHQPVSIDLDEQQQQQQQDDQQKGQRTPDQGAIAAAHVNSHKTSSTTAPAPPQPQLKARSMKDTQSDGASPNEPAPKPKATPPFTAQCTSFFGQYKPEYDENTPFYLFSGFGYLGKWLNLTTTTTTIPNYSQYLSGANAADPSSLEANMVYATQAVNVTFIMDRGREICALSETELLLLYPNEPKYLLHRYCWFSAYISALLHDGFRFSLDSNNIHFVANVAKTDVTYSAGAMVYLTNQLPYYVQYNVSSSAGAPGLSALTAQTSPPSSPSSSSSTVSTILITGAIAMLIGILGTAVALQYLQLRSVKRELKTNQAKWLGLHQDKYKQFGYNNHTPNANPGHQQQQQQQPQSTNYGSFNSMASPPPLHSHPTTATNSTNVPPAPPSTYQSYQQPNFLATGSPSVIHSTGFIKKSISTTSLASLNKDSHYQQKSGNLTPNGSSLNLQRENSSSHPPQHQQPHLGLPHPSSFISPPSRQGNNSSRRSSEVTPLLNNYDALLE